MPAGRQAVRGHVGLALCRFCLLSAMPAKGNCRLTGMISFACIAGVFVCHSATHTITLFSVRIFSTVYTFTVSNEVMFLGLFPWELLAACGKSLLLRSSPVIAKVLLSGFTHSTLHHCPYMPLRLSFPQCQWLLLRTAVLSATDNFALVVIVGFMSAFAISNFSVFVSVLLPQMLFEP